jgi:hypothetical protein
MKCGTPKTPGIFADKIEHECVILQHGLDEHIAAVCAHNPCSTNRLAHSEIFAQLMFPPQQAKLRSDVLTEQSVPLNGKFIEAMSRSVQPLAGTIRPIARVTVHGDIEFHCVIRTQQISSCPLLEQRDVPNAFDRAKHDQHAALLLIAN